MSLDRFQLVMHFFHFGDRPNFAGYRLAKIRLLTNHLNQIMEELYVPDKNLSLNESMMLWRGRLLFRQYIKNKRHKYGIKYSELCTSDGLILRASIYSGQSFDDDQSLGQSGAIVLNLMHEILDKSYHLFTDTYYNLVPLTHYLTSRSTYLTGTLRKDRVDNPKRVVNNGEVTWESNEEVSVCKWKDKRDVLAITNAHVPEMCDVTNRNGKTKKKPNLVRDYNNGMSGIDRSDQMLSYHSALRKTICSYKKVGIHMLEMLLANVHFLYRHSTPHSKTMNEFKEDIKWLVGELTVPKYNRPLANFHYFASIPPTDKNQ